MLMLTNIDEIMSCILCGNTVACHVDEIHATFMIRRPTCYSDEQQIGWKISLEAVNDLMTIHDIDVFKILEGVSADILSARNKKRVTSSCF